jgi:hypothetical protein
VFRFLGISFLAPYHALAVTLLKMNKGIYNYVHKQYKIKKDIPILKKLHGNR